MYFFHRLIYLSILSLSCKTASLLLEFTDGLSHAEKLTSLFVELLTKTESIYSIHKNHWTNKEMFKSSLIVSLISHMQW